MSPRYDYTYFYGTIIQNTYVLYFKHYLGETRCSVPYTSYVIRENRVVGWDIRMYLSMWLPVSVIRQVCSTHAWQISTQSQRKKMKNSLSSEQCDQKKSPKVYKSCSKMISLEKFKILTPFQKLQKNVGDLGKLIAAKGFKKLPKVQ